MSSLFRLLGPLRDAVALRNVGYMTLVQVANLVIPLLTLPWVLRALLPTAYGTYAFYGAIAQYFLLFVDFGFGLAGAKRVAETRSDPGKLSAYFWSVQAAKTMLCAIAISVALVALVVVPEARRDARVILATLPAVIGSVLSPTWLFMGLERMGLVSMAGLAVRVASIPFILLLVRDPGDAWIAAAINSAGWIGSGLIAIAIIVRGRLIPHWVQPRWGNILAALVDAWHLFVSSAAVSLYVASNTVVLGLVSPPAQVGIFGAAERVRQAGLMPIPPISTAFYPRISRLVSEDLELAMATARRLLLVLGAAMAMASIILFLAAPLIVHVMMGAGYEGAVTVLRIMSPTPFLVALNTVLGTLTMITLGYKRTFSRILLSTGLVNLTLIGALGASYGAAGAASALLFSETLVTALMAWFVRKDLFRPA